MFGLSAADFAEEPADKIATNLYIEAQIREKERLESKHGSDS